MFSDSSGIGRERRHYFPFGEEALSSGGGNVTLGFTGHELDANDSTGTIDDLTYMVARYQHPQLGRFLSFDPGDSAKPAKPQTWNKYTYAINNPIRFVDPDGRTEREGWKAGTVLNNSSQPVYIAFDRNGTTTVFALFPQANTSPAIQDADAIIPAPGQSIDGKTEGAFKIGPADMVVEDQEGGKEGELTLDGDMEYGLLLLLGKAGFLTPEEAERLGWVIPTGRDEEEAQEMPMPEEKQLEHR